MTSHDEVIALIQADKEGKQIQWIEHDGDDWTDVGLSLHGIIASLFRGTPLRVKPAALEMWALFKKADGRVGTLFGPFASKQEAWEYNRHTLQDRDLEPICLVEAQ